MNVGAREIIISSGIELEKNKILRKIFQKESSLKEVFK